MPTRIEYHKGDLLGPNKIEFIEETEPRIYSNQTKGRRANFICPYCGNIFNAGIKSIKAGSTKGCGCQHIKYKIEDYKNKKFNRLTILEKDAEYYKSGSKIPYFICQCDCGKIVRIRAYSVVNGLTKSCGCLHQEYAENQYKDISNQKFGKLTAIRPTDKRTSYHSVIWECKCDCGNIVTIPAKLLVAGHTQSCGCLKNNSKGEWLLESLLRNLKIDYIKEYRFDNCKNYHTLPFDFYLPQYNICIEYDGIQHYIGWNRDKDNLIKIQKNDKIKNQYCKDNNIKLIRIPYWDYDKLNEEYLLSLIEG